MKIGLIGGLAHRAGVFYYEQLVQRLKRRDERLELMLAHADVRTVLALVAAEDRAGLGNYLGTLANELFDGGADVVAISAVAPHLSFAETSRIARGPLVNALDTIATGIAAAGFERVAIFGNRAVMETNAFGAILKRAVVVLEPARLEQIHATYTEIALHGKRGTAREVDVLDTLARDLIEKGGAQAIVLAGTDLSSFYAERGPDYPFLDVAQLHIDEIERRMMDRP